MLSARIQWALIGTVAFLLFVGLVLICWPLYLELIQINRQGPRIEFQQLSSPMTGLIVLVIAVALLAFAALADRNAGKEERTLDSDANEAGNPAPPPIPAAKSPDKSSNAVQARLFGTE